MIGVCVSLSIDHHYKPFIMSDDTTTQTPQDGFAFKERGITISIPENGSGKNVTREKVLAKHQQTDVDDAEPQAHLHARTFLAVFAMCLVYFAQDFALVGAGSVRSKIS